jgi:hypothetical protein
MTDAERTLADFNNATKTISLVLCAKRAGAEREKHGKCYIYKFADGSRIIASGRGSNHSIHSDAETR